MKLVRARITNYKSVLDSTWFSLGDLTCLVGKNESGKTAILEALEKLGSVRPERQELKDTDYPRMNWSEYEETTTVDNAIEAEWQLDAAEIQHLQALTLDPENFTATTVRVTKNYNNELYWAHPFDLVEVVKSAVNSSQLTDELKSWYITNCSTTTELLKQLKAKTDPTGAETDLLTKLIALWPSGGVQPTCAAYLNGLLPKFVYYSQYDRLPGRVSLTQLTQAQQTNTLEDVPGSRIFVALLQMVGTTPEEIETIDTSELLISKLEAVETRLSKTIFKYWSQNKHLKVRFRFDAAAPADPAPYNTGKIFQTRIENTRHEATIRLDERSTGFIWFFSFLVWFSQVQKEFGGNLIVLLDEPGLTLHARAQEDLLRYIKEQLLPKYQVIYTTHSPFMIDSRDLLSCRTVEDATGPDDQVLGTKVGDQVLSTDTDTLFPLQAALGYDVTQTMFVGAHSLLVEGPSDLLYLQWASQQLRKQKRIGLDPRWTVTPCGGITKIPSFLSLFGGSDLHVAVLTDYGDGDKKKVRELRESELLQAGHVFSAETYVAGATEADVEDMLGRELYSELVTKTYGLTAKQQLAKTPKGDAPARVTVEVEDQFRTLPATVEEYEHFAPSSYLIAHPEEFSGAVVDVALDRFEKLFHDLNELL